MGEKEQEMLLDILYHWGRITKKTTYVNGRATIRSNREVSYLYAYCMTKNPEQPLTPLFELKDGFFLKVKDHMCMCKENQEKNKEEYEKLLLEISTTNPLLL